MVRRKHLGHSRGAVAEASAAPEEEPPATPPHDRVAATPRLRGLLHLLPAGERRGDVLVGRSARRLRRSFTRTYVGTARGPGRMSRALLGRSLSDAMAWTGERRSRWSAVFATLALQPALGAPVRRVYRDLHRRLKADDLPPGVAEVVGAAVSGLWLERVLGLAPNDIGRVARVRDALRRMIAPSTAARTAGAWLSRGRV